MLRTWILKRRIKKARKLLILIDEGIKWVGMPRQARRRLWRDFAKGEGDHAEIFDLLGM